VQPPEQVDDLAAGLVGPQRDIAGHVGQPPVQGGGLPPRVAVQQPGRPAVGSQQAQQYPDRRGLPGAVRAEEPMHLAGAHAQVKPVQRARPAEGLAEARDLDHVAHMA
jgi:hypothetical protein